MTWQDSINAPVSAQGEYAAKKFYGDPKLATAYLPVAYALLGGVKNQMALSGVGFGHRMVELRDGTRIRVIRNGTQNIVEIDVSRVVPPQKEDYAIIFYYTFYPKRAGYPSGYIRPKDEKNPYGQRAKVAWELDGREGYISVIRLKYPQLREDGPVTKKSPILSAARLTERLSGNQFCFDQFTCYSWWWSPSGDGPLAIYLTIDEIPFTYYRPFLMFGVLLCYLYPGADIKPIPPLCHKFLMKNGKVFYESQQPIVGMQIITYKVIENKKYVTKKAGMLLFYGIDLITGVMLNLATAETIGPAIPIFTRNDIRADDENLLVDLAWPWRFNDDGSEVSAIVREKKKRKSGLPVDVDLLVVTIKLSYSKDGVQRDNVAIQRHPRPRTTTITLNSTSIGEPPFRDPGAVATGWKTGPGRTMTVLQSRGRYTGERTNATQIVDEYEVPFALNYIDDELTVFKFSYTRQSKQEAKEFIGWYGDAIYRIFDKWVRIPGNINGNYDITVEIKYLAGSELWEGETYEVTDDFVATGVSNLFDLSYHSESHSRQAYKNYRHAIPELSFTAHMVGGWGPLESRTETYSEALTSDVQRSNEYSSSSSMTHTVRIPYINLKANAIVFYKYINNESVQSAYIPARRLRQTGFGRPLPNNNPYNGGTEYNTYINMGDIAEDSVSSTASSASAVNYAGEFVMYDDVLDEEQREVSSSSSSGQASWFSPVGLFSGITTKNEVRVIEDIAPDPTNSWVATWDTVSVAADYYRPPLIDKEPTYMAIIDIPYLSKQYADFGKGPADLKKLLPDEPSLNPIGMF